MPDESYQPKVYRKQGGDEFVVAAGGKITLEDGGSIITPLEVVTADFTVSAAESGKSFIINGTDKTATLPATVAGLEFTFFVKAVSTTTGFSISPVTADAIHYTTSTDDKDLINTAATDVEGDSVTIVGDGVDGWWVKAITGTWAKE